MPTVVSCFGLANGAMMIPSPAGRGRFGIIVVDRASVGPRPVAGLP